MSTKSKKRDILSLNDDELSQFLSEHGQAMFRVKQIKEWLWVHHVRSFNEMTNLPVSLRSTLEENFSFNPAAELAKQVSLDGSRKYLLAFSDGVAAECVGMPRGNKLSVCVSSQAGCAMRCSFCATGAAGLTRSLSASEIYDQVMHISDDFEMRATSVVFMGQGEPFANYDETLIAMRRLNNPDGAGIGARHITVSTCGIIPMIRRFSHEPEQFTLAVSLHSAVQSTRNKLMPGVKKYSLERLHEVMQEYVETTGRRPSYEYALMGDINDTKDELEALIDFCRGTLCHVNLIQLNEVPSSPFKPSTDEKAREFVTRLANYGVEATVRESRGADIDAACGQLKQRKLKGR